MKANVLPFREQPREYPRGGVANGEIVEPGQSKIVIGCLIDTSSSMPEDELNKGNRIFVEELKKDDMIRARGDMIVVTFDDKARIVQPFRSVYDIKSIEFSCGGMTAMHSGLDVITKEMMIRDKEYTSRGIPRYQMALFVLTDGKPNDEDNGVIERLNKMKEKDVIVYPIAIGDKADIEFLKTISSLGKVLRVGEDNISKTFQWISRSLALISESKPGDVVTLPDPREYQIDIVC